MTKKHAPGRSSTDVLVRNQQAARPKKGQDKRVMQRTLVRNQQAARPKKRR